MINSNQVESCSDFSHCECQVPSDQSDPAVRSDSDESNTLAMAAVTCCNKTGKNVSVIPSARTTDVRPGMFVTTFIYTDSNRYQVLSYLPFRFLWRALPRLPVCLIFQSSPL